MNTWIAVLPLSLGLALPPAAAQSAATAPPGPADPAELVEALRADLDPEGRLRFGRGEGSAAAALRAVERLGGRGPWLGWSLDEGRHLVLGRGRGWDLDGLDAQRSRTLRLGWVAPAGQGAAWSLVLEDGAGSSPRLSLGWARPLRLD